MTTMKDIDQMMRDAEQTQQQAREELTQAEEFEMQGVQLNEASKLVTIYQRETGEPRVLPKLAAEMALRKKYRDSKSPLFGQFIFSAKPTKQYHYGKQRCMLHPDEENRPKFDEWGLPICESAHLASPGEVRRHMELRHPSAYKIIREDEAELRHQNELQAQNALAQAVLEAVKGLKPEDAQAVKASMPKKVREIVGTPDAPLYVKEK